jgi:hypothetical protein
MGRGGHKKTACKPALQTLKISLKEEWHSSYCDGCPINKKETEA